MHSARQLAVVAAALLVPFIGAAHAEVFDYRYTTVLDDASTPGVAVGDTLSIDLFMDNGGTRAASQVWMTDQVLYFTAHAGTYTATYDKTFAAIPFEFITDASGAVTLAQFYGTDSTSHNSDNFSASFTGDDLFSNPAFTDSLGRYNAAAGTDGGLANVSNWKEVTSVPEPADIVLLLAGLGVMGSAARRRKA